MVVEICEIGERRPLTSLKMGKSPPQMRYATKKRLLIDSDLSDDKSLIEDSESFLKSESSVVKIEDESTTKWLSLTQYDED